MLKQNLLVSVSAMALLAAMATAGISQSPSGGGSGAGQEQQKMNPGESNRGTETQDRGAREQPTSKGRSAQRDGDTQPKASDRAEEKATPKSRVQGQDATPKASDRAQEKAAPKSAVQGKKDDDDRRSSAAGDKGKESTKQSDQGTAKDRDRTAGESAKEQRGDRTGSSESKDAPKQSGKEPAKDRDRAAGDGSKDGREDRQRADRNAGERVQLSEQKRTSVRERLSKSAQSNRVTNVNFDIRVGASVPRSATLHVLPPDVVEIVPEYRNYRYVYVRDEIVIIDPSDYVVVAVIGGDSRVGSRSRGRITLSSDDRVFVRRHVDLGARVRLGIGNISIGMNLPDTVELRPLPEAVVERHPDFRGHRYFIYEDDVVIVEPQSREVVLVVED